MEQEQKEKDAEASGRPSNDEEDEDEGKKESADVADKRTQFDELSRQIKNLTPIVNSYILANLNKLSD